MRIYATEDYFEFHCDGFVYRCCARNIAQAKEMLLNYISNMIDDEINDMLSDHCKQKQYLYNIEVQKEILDIFKMKVILANQSESKSIDRVYYNGYWKGIKEATSVLNPNILLDENKVD